MQDREFIRKENVYRVLKQMAETMPGVVLVMPAI